MLRLLMTRPQEDSDRFVAALGSDVLRGVEVITSPLFRIEHVAAALDLTGYHGLIFTSRNGVRSADVLGVTKDLPCFCVGAQTTALASQLGWQAQMAGQNADELVANLPEVLPQTPLLHIRGAHARGAISARLSKNGLPASETVVYDQIAQDFTPEAKAALAEDHPVIAPLLSPRTARQFAKHVNGTGNLWLATLSEAVAAECKGLKKREIAVADAPTASALARLVKELISVARRVEGEDKPQ
jgi:uroporphyrinogen-III synthase